MAAHADVVVLGGGVIGAAIAWELARRGTATVTVLDPRQPGSGATQASAGMLAPYSEAASGGPLLDLTVRGLETFDPFLSDLRLEVPHAEIPYARDGLLEVAAREDGLARLAALARELERWRIPAELLDRVTVRECEPLLAGDVVGGLLIPRQGAVVPRAFYSALYDAAVARGVRFERARAVRVSNGRQGTNHLTVETDGGHRSADWVIMAAGCRSGQIDIDGTSLAAPVRPVRGQLLALDWPAPVLRRVTWNERCYLVPGADGTLLVGATVEDAGFAEHNTVAGIRDLIDAVCDLLPRAGDASFREARVGLRPGTPDGLPILGPSTVHPRLVFATGHYRNGILLAPLTAKMVAAVVVDGVLDPMLRAARPNRFGQL